MSRRELISLLILDVIADDYENLAKIVEELNGFASRCGLSLEHSEVSDALRGLIDAGLAKPYRLSQTHEDVDREVRPNEVTELSDYYFWITDKGRLLHERDDWWPFNEQGLLKEGWSLAADKKE
jgi:hypothetical protein